MHDLVFTSFFWSNFTHLVRVLEDVIFLVQVWVVNLWLLELRHLNFANNNSTVGLWRQRLAIKVPPHH